MGYKELIPDTPTEELFSYMYATGAFKENVLTFKAIGREDARAAYYDHNFAGDFRENMKKRAARCWCSGCEQMFIAEYISSKTCSGWVNQAGVRLENGYTVGVEEVAEGHSIICPHCGELAVLRGAAYMRFGHTEQYFITRAYNVRGCVVFVKYMVEQKVWHETTENKAEPFEAFVVDGKKVVKLRLWQKGMMGQCFRLPDWAQNARISDTLGAPLFYADDLPDLEGTSLENAKLWEYMEQSYGKDVFYPLAYARLYLKHKNVENLITSGFGALVGEGIREEESRSSYYYEPIVPSPKLNWVNWSQDRPSKMLGLNKEELRTLCAEKWDLKKMLTYKAVAHKLNLNEAVTAMRVLTCYDLKEMVEDAEWSGQKIMRTVRYLTKTKCDLTTLKDYWRMAQVIGLDLNNPVIRWPRDLRAAHNRVQTAQRYTTTQAERDAFVRMTERCRGLNWTDGEICIRVAESPEELAQEGKTLQHCVGTYTEDHANGSIILFIRHARRPERSWFTLNVDVVTKRIRQNHGYYNELLPGGKVLTIPKKVQQFVEEWQRQVLTPWKLPPAERKKEHPRRDGKKNAAA